MLCITLWRWSSDLTFLIFSFAPCNSLVPTLFASWTMVSAYLNTSENTLDPTSGCFADVLVSYFFQYPKEHFRKYWCCPIFFSLSLLIVCDALDVSDNALLAFGTKCSQFNYVCFNSISDKSFSMISWALAPSPSAGSEKQSNSSIWFGMSFPGYLGGRIVFLHNFISYCFNYDLPRFEAVLTRHIFHGIWQSVVLQLWIIIILLICHVGWS